MAKQLQLIMNHPEAFKIPKVTSRALDEIDFSLYRDIFFVGKDVFNNKEALYLTIIKCPPEKNFYIETDGFRLSKMDWQILDAMQIKGLVITIIGIEHYKQLVDKHYLGQFGVPLILLSGLGEFMPREAYENEYKPNVDTFILK